MLLLEIETMVLVEERNVVTCLKIYEEVSFTLRLWFVVACCWEAAAPGTRPKVAGSLSCRRFDRVWIEVRTEGGGGVGVGPFLVGRGAWF
jgi:hypothetical protein